MLTVDLLEAEIDHWMRFDAAMASRQWVKFPNIGSAFCTIVEGSPTDQEIIDQSSQDVEEAAKAANVLVWSGVCVVSGSAPVAF